MFPSLEDYSHTRIRLLMVLNKTIFQGRSSHIASIVRTLVISLLVYSELVNGPGDPGQPTSKCCSLVYCTAGHSLDSPRIPPNLISYEHHTSHHADFFFCHMSPECFSFQTLFRSVQKSFPQPAGSQLLLGTKMREWVGCPRAPPGRGTPPRVF